MLRISFFLLLLIFTTGLFSQKYTTAAGIRLGGGMGITVQQHLWSKYTLEAQLQKGFSSGLTTFTALLEQHHAILSKGTNFYLGAGPHFGSQKIAGKDADTRGVFGASFIGGLETKLGNTLLAFDLKPVINLSGGSFIFDTQAGISLRYIFLKQAKKEQNWMFWKKKKAKM